VRRRPGAESIEDEAQAQDDADGQGRARVHGSIIDPRHARKTAMRACLASTSSDRLAVVGMSGSGAGSLCYDSRPFLATFRSPSDVQRGQAHRSQPG
jgi:hypothetical protein